MGVWRDVHVGRCGSAPFPSLVRRGGRAAPGVVCSKSRSHLTDVAKRSLLIGTFVFEQTAPASLRDGIPALLRRGMGRVTLVGQHSLGEEGKIANSGFGQ